MSGMREVIVDAEQHLVHAGGGCLLGDIDEATARHGMIVPAGIMSETGVGGLALGGGIGWFSRRYGLTCDQFVALRLVLASGEVIAELTDQAIDTLVDFWKDMPMNGEVEIIGLGGAIGDVPEEATAFSNRGYLMWLNFAMSWDDPARDGDYIERTRKVVGDLKPWTGQGIYVNMLNFDEMDRVVEAFGGPEKYARLGRVKAQYDPDNFFRMNYNITPRPGTE